MGYTIEYARQFIRSESGYTAVWLAGPSNVTENCAGRERRVREWGVWAKQLGVSEQELLIATNKMLGGYLWKKGGKFLDDDGLIKWVITGMRNAMTVEDILAANPEILRVACSLCDENCHRSFEQSVRTTRELDEWIAQVKSAPEYGAAFPVVSFGSGVETVRAMPKEKDDETGYCVKRGRDLYLSALDDRSCAYSRNREEALVFPYEQAAEAMRRTGGTRVVSAAAKSPRQKAVIRLTSQVDASVRYLYRNTRGRLAIVSVPGGAWQYSSVSSARRTLNDPGFRDLLESHGWTAEVVPVEDI